MNSQRIEHQSLDGEGNLFVHSVFHTIQGEGPNSGRPAVFVRLTGCNLQCPMCDTEYTGSRIERSPGGLTTLIETLTDERGTDLVVITGGEPFRQNFTWLARSLIRRGYEVQVETNGTLWLDDLPSGVQIVCSPKTPKINKHLAERVAAFKYVLDADHVADDGLPSRALGCNGEPARPPIGYRGRIYLSPADVQDGKENARNLRAVTDSCLKFGYTLNLQLHKILSLP